MLLCNENKIMTYVCVCIDRDNLLIRTCCFRSRMNTYLAEMNNLSMRYILF